MVCPSCSTSFDAAIGSCPHCNWTASDAAVTDTGPPRTDPDLTREGSSTDSRHALQPGQRLTSRYTILKLLGAGGMGEVYQAWDEVVSTPVALKIIRPQLVTERDQSQQLEERFRRELRLARQVTHPNVIRIHDIGELGDTKFLTMEYVPGSDLGRVLRRSGRLSAARALSVAREVAGGLAAVHAAGVVHRDLKPANIILDEQDHAHVTDFGIARAIDAHTIQTVPGALIGTLDYMAPEQARGQVADQRSDVYAFGLILYEMLAGGRPKTKSDSTLGSLIERLENGPPPLATVAPDVPADLERVVTRCLAAEPAKRYGSFPEVLADLERLGPDGRATLVARRTARGVWMAATTALAAGLLTAAGILWFTISRRPAGPPAPHEPLSVVIADFTNAAQDPVFDGSLEQALGVSIEGASFINTYSRRPGVKLNEADARLLAVREGIAVVLAGTVARTGNGYQISVKALNPATGDATVSAEARAPTKAEVLQAVGNVAEQLRRGLGDTTPPSQLKAETFTASSLEAMKSYTTAQELSTNRKNDEAIQYYRKAIEQDPNFGRAYAGWAAAAFDSGRRDEGNEVWGKALALVDKMTERERYRTLGTYFLQVEHNNEKAIENDEKLVQLYPADLAGLNNLAVAYFYSLRFSDALREGRRAIDLYPKRLKFRGNYALYAMYASDFKTAADSARGILEEDPSYVAAYLPLAMEALASGHPDEAKKVYETAAGKGAEGASLAAIGLADVALFEGRYADAETILEPAIATDRQQQNTAGVASKLVALAEAQAGLGRRAPALKTIAEALAVSKDDATIVPAVRLMLSEGAGEQAQGLMRELSGRLQPQSRAYARILEAERSLPHGVAGQTMDALAAGKALADLWLGRLVSGMAYETFGHRVEARDELDTCAKRLGEATAMFLDDIPTFRYTRVLREWQQRAGGTSAPSR
jgi:tetratricopeptide (TPR) repeat protein